MDIKCGCVVSCLSVIYNKRQFLHRVSLGSTKLVRCAESRKFARFCVLTIIQSVLLPASVLYREVACPQWEGPLWEVPLYITLWVWHSQNICLTPTESCGFNDIHRVFHLSKEYS